MSNGRITRHIPEFLTAVAAGLVVALIQPYFDRQKASIALGKDLALLHHAHYDNAQIRLNLHIAGSSKLQGVCRELGLKIRRDDELVGTFDSRGRTDINGTAILDPNIANPQAGSYVLFALNRSDDHLPIQIVDPGRYNAVLSGLGPTCPDEIKFSFFLPKKKSAQLLAALNSDAESSVNIAIKHSRGIRYWMLPMAVALVAGAAAWFFRAWRTRRKRSIQPHKGGNDSE